MKAHKKKDNAIGHGKHGEARGIPKTAGRPSRSKSITCVVT